MGYLLALALGLVVSGCGGKVETSPELPTFEVPVLDEDRKRFLEEFPLLDEQGEIAPPKYGDLKTAPFGALVYMPRSGQGSFCSVSHLSDGKVATNAHCVDSDSRPYNYFVIYFDKEGQKQFAQVEALQFVGSPRLDDFAILVLDRSLAEEFDTIEGTLLRTKTEVSADPPVAHEVTIWSYDPIKENHEELYERYRMPGMKFVPKNCLASRTQPRAFGVVLDSSGDESRRVGFLSPNADEAVHLFIDGCAENRYPVKGNSGSLISVHGDPKQAMGVYHWGIRPRKALLAEFDYVSYSGNDARLLRYEIDELPHDLYGIGTAFESVESVLGGL